MLSSSRKVDPITCRTAGSLTGNSSKRKLPAGHRHVLQFVALLVVLAFSYSTAHAGRPGTPKNLTVTGVSETQIALKWQDRSNNETGFQVQRAPSSTGPWTLIATLAANTTTYTNTGLTPATTYSYKVLAYNNSGSTAT